MEHVTIKRLKEAIRQTLDPRSISSIPPQKSNPPPDRLTLEPQPIVYSHPEVSLMN
jgi:hypothetical protein